MSIKNSNDIIGRMEHSWNVNDGEMLKYTEKNLPLYQFVRSITHTAGFM